MNCGSWNAHCSVCKVEIISVAFKWLIILRSAHKTCHATQFLKMHLLLPKMCKTITISSTKAAVSFTVVLSSLFVYLFVCLTVNQSSCLLCYIMYLVGYAHASNATFTDPVCVKSFPGDVLRPICHGGMIIQSEF